MPTCATGCVRVCLIGFLNLFLSSRNPFASAPGFEGPKGWSRIARRLCVVFFVCFFSFGLIGIHWIIPHMVPPSPYLTLLPPPSASLRPIIFTEYAPQRRNRAPTLPGKDFGQAVRFPDPLECIFPPVKKGIPFYPSVPLTHCHATDPAAVEASGECFPPTVGCHLQRGIRRSKKKKTKHDEKLKRNMI